MPSMKLAFWKRKKREEPAPEPPQPILPIFVCGESETEGGAGPAELPADCEAVCAEEPRGRYILFADGMQNCGGTEDLAALLAERSEELLLFRTDAKAEAPSAEELLRQGLEPRRIGYVASLELFRRLPVALRRAGRGERLAALLLLAETAATLDFVGEDRETAHREERAAQSLRAFLLLFDEIKPRLDREKYRFAFAYACGRVIGTYAELAAENKAEELRLFDDFLKEENMALRVAAKERSAIVRQLTRRNFRPPLWLRPLCAAAAARDRARR